MSTRQLKKENQELRDEVSKLTEKLDKLSSELLKTTSKTNEESRQDGRHDLLPRRESSEQTANLCLSLFRALGIKDVSILDIDIAHRVPARRPSNKPNAVICKFTRRLAKEQVMAVRRGVADV